MCSYIKNRKQRVQINSNLRAAKTIIAGIPQDSTDGPPLFYLFVNDSVLFLRASMLINCEDDDNLFSIGKDINRDTLAKDFEIVSNSFYENLTVLNSEKCYFLYTGRDVENETFTFKDICYKNSKAKVILGITSDNKLNFNKYAKYVKEICVKNLVKN